MLTGRGFGTRCYRTENPCGVGQGAFCTRNRIKNRMCKRGLTRWWWSVRDTRLTWCSRSFQGSDRVRGVSQRRNWTAESQVSCDARLTAGRLTSRDVLDSCSVYISLVCFLVILSLGVLISVNWCRLSFSPRLGERQVEIAKLHSELQKKVSSSQFSQPTCPLQTALSGRASDVLCTPGCLDCSPDLRFSGWRNAPNRTEWSQAAFTAKLQGQPHTFCAVDVGGYRYCCRCCWCCFSCGRRRRFSRCGDGCFCCSCCRFVAALFVLWWRVLMWWRWLLLLLSLIILFQCYDGCCCCCGQLKEKLTSSDEAHAAELEGMREQVAGLTAELHTRYVDCRPQSWVEARNFSAGEWRRKRQNKNLKVKCCAFSIWIC